MRIEDLTPVEYFNNERLWLKRDDKFTVYGVKGGKSRAAYQIIGQLLNRGYKTIVTAGSRQSPQCEIVSYICERMQVYCVVFMPNGEDTSVIENISQNQYTLIKRVSPGYNNVIVARAREYAEACGYGYVPFGMECEENVEVTSKQVANLPFEELRYNLGRLVIPVGSGMSFSSVITGLSNIGVYDIPILGVRVGKDPSKILRTYAPELEMFNYEIVDSDVSYHTPVEAYVGDVNLDPIYEAKCRKYLKPYDCLWVVGHRL